VAVVNPYFPVGYNGYQYPQYMPQQMMQNQYGQMQQQQSGGLVWVQGIEGAKSHHVDAGQSVLLMDSESNCFFIKSADSSGMPLPLRIFDYTERTANNQQQQPAQTVETIIDTTQFVSREEFENRIAQIISDFESKQVKTQFSKRDGERNNGK
jgi:hypothetical protein